MPYSARYQEAPLSAHPKKLIRFAELYAKGIHSIAEAARQAGYSAVTADKSAYAWLGKNRESSEFPVLWDHYEKLRRENLRELDITAHNIARELALIGFSDVTRYIDLPRLDYDRRARLALETEAAIYRIENYEVELEAYTLAVEKQERQTRGKKVRLVRPRAPTQDQHKLYNAFLMLDKDARAELMVWRSYRSGSIRLKNAEEIPTALLPVIAELSESKDGVKIKLHDKISALDKLAKWQKMYAAEPEDEGAPRTITEINLVVNGSKSRLLAPLPQSDAAA